MFIAEIKRVVDQISRDKGIDKDALIEAIEEAIKSAARKKYGVLVDIETQYNEDTGEVEVFQFKEVAETVTEPDLEISLAMGRQLDPDCQVGDSLGTKMDTTDFGRIAAQSAKQVIIQKMKEAERQSVYTNFIDRRGELINGIVQRFERGNLIVNLGSAEAVLPYREQVPRESYRRGDRVRAYIMEVSEEARGPQVILSRTHPDFLVHLFRTEVPEISEGIVTIMGAAREPGIRAKIAVSSSESDVDPVGACVGMRGSRVQTVVQELRGEKIDIVPWHPDPARFVCNALAPAEVSRVIIDEGNNTMEVIVPDESLSLAIGKRGQNVRLASKLSGWRLDVVSESQYNETMKEAYAIIAKLPGMTGTMADLLYESGFYSVEELSRAKPADVAGICGVDEETAVGLIAAAADPDVVAQATAVAEAEAAAAAAAEAEAEAVATAAAEAAAAETAEVEAADAVEGAETQAVEAETTAVVETDDEPEAADAEEGTETQAVEVETTAVVETDDEPEADESSQTKTDSVADEDVLEDSNESEPEPEQPLSGDQEER